MLKDLPPDREAEILACCLEGDWSDYGEIVERYKPLVWSAVDAATDDKASIPDLVQEVFVKAYEKLYTFNMGGKFSSWIYRIARNHTLNHTRRFKVRRAVSLEAVQEDSGRSIAQNGEGPEKIVEKEARAAALEAMISRLPESYRMVLNMFYQGEMSYEEIAGETNMPLNTVRTHLRRARLKLAEFATEEGWKS